MNWMLAEVKHDRWQSLQKVMHYLFYVLFYENNWGKKTASNEYEPQSFKKYTVHVCTFPSQTCGCVSSSKYDLTKNKIKYN